MSQRKKLTVHDLLKLKKSPNKRQLTEVFVETPQEAAACEAAGIDMLVCMGDEIGKSIREAAPTCFVTMAISRALAVSEKATLEAGFRQLSNGADAVYTSMSSHRVSQMAREKIPVVGHVGFVPLQASWTGGFKAVGKTADQALRILEDTLAYEDAGAIGVEVEIVPARVAEEISKRTDILVISMGAGAGCDAQYLFYKDLLATHNGHIPRHAKVYRKHFEEYERLQNDAVEALKEFQNDVITGAFPTEATTLKIQDEEWEKFLDRI